MSTVTDDSADSIHCEPVQRVGSYRYWFDSDVWEWSPEVAAMHGYGRDEVAPTTELLRRHQHPDNRASFDEMMDDMRASRTHFSGRHTIIDTAGSEHLVSVVGRTFTGPDGTVAGSEGFYLDMGDPSSEDPGTGQDQTNDEAVREQVSAHVLEFRQNHAPIEQAKGMLMLVYGIDHDRAFEVLRWRSQQENRRLYDVARAIVDAAAARAQIPAAVRREFDQVVLTPFDD